MANRQLEWRCDAFFGQRPYAASCEDAARHMAFIAPGSDDTRVFLWGRREWPAIDVPLPQAVVSCKRLRPTLSGNGNL